MVTNKSPDEMLDLIIALLCDIQKLHSGVISPRAMRLTIQKVEKRVAREGNGFLTKTLPHLGKALDRALAEGDPLDATSVAFEPMPNSKLPKFLGELFMQVLSSDGRVLPCPDVTCVRSLRAVLFLFYKYELPYDPETEQEVIDKFIKTEDDVCRYSCMFDVMSDMLAHTPEAFYQLNAGISPWVVRRARRLLFEVFRGFDPGDISPQHGPGAVAGKQRGFEKYEFEVVSPRLLSKWPYDAYFSASVNHLSDKLQHGEIPVALAESFARVCLVPKDSRGPRTISCEPHDFQWVQQGLRKAIVRLVEKHPLTKDAIHFTDQTPNAFGALLGSLTGGYATLDLNEASDRISVGLVRLLFPEPVLSALLHARSLATVLPDGRILRLQKYAPMGSALCFVVLALTVWAILAASMNDAEGTNAFLVYGDDVVVQSAQAENAMNSLEAFGLKINRNKSCTKGFFRESCGIDAFHGVDVTPVKIHTVWQNHRSPSVYTSFIAYANEFWRRQYYDTYGVITGWLHAVYGKIPAKDQMLSCPSLAYVPVEQRPNRTRWNKALQRTEYHVWDVRTVDTFMKSDGWSYLFSFFTNAAQQTTGVEFRDGPCCGGVQARISDLIGLHVLHTAGQYTERGDEKLSLVWRSIAPQWRDGEPVKDPADVKNRRDFPTWFAFNG